jgi:type IX secretion system PorP/SprF family membrane protein
MFMPQKLKHQVLPVIYILLLASIFHVNQVRGQLPIFTQFSQNQLNINPSFAGYFDEDIKVNALYRSQAYSRLITSTFTNASFQMRPYVDFIPENDVLGFGVNAYSHKTLNAYSHNALSATMSYSKGLDYAGTQTLAIGFQGRYNSKRVDYTQLLFPNQFDIIGYTPILPNNEPIQVINTNFLDLNAGLLYSAVGENEAFTGGFSIYNVNQISSDKAKLASRDGLTYNYHLGYSRYVSEYSQIFLGGLHSSSLNQGATSIVGAVQFMPDYARFIGFDIGGIYVLNNSFSPFVNLNMNFVRASFTYNVPISPNISYVQQSNAFEIGIQFLFSRPTENNTIAKRHMSCFK